MAEGRNNIQKMPSVKEMCVAEKCLVVLEL